MKKWAADVKRHFCKEDTQMATRRMKRHPALVGVGEMQIKTTASYCLMPVRMTFINKSKNNNCWRGYREKGTLTCCW